MIVLDANILIRAVLGKRVGRLLEEYSMRGVRFFAPDLAYADAADYLPLLLGKKGAADVDASSIVRDMDRRHRLLWHRHRGLDHNAY
jgi:PIN domain